MAKLFAILSGAFALKYFYATASVNELRWILAPTTLLVEIVSGRTFNFEMHAGYMSSDRSFLIASSCAGVNFMIAAFSMLSIAKLWRGKLSWKLIPAALLISYAMTIVANTVRISTALHLQNSRLDIAGLSGNQLHRLEGILIYFGFLLLLFLLSERTLNQTAAKPNGGPLRISEFILPLFVYYATTLGIPLANAIYRQEFAATTFLEHSVFVLLIPLLLILPIALIELKNRNTSTLV
ncbi:MAG TPA: exosortase K [Pyrinomonadaceae bacterium]|nr:exosortase K [Pyrinomonadaceae bacterium]